MVYEIMSDKRDEDGSVFVFPCRFSFQALHLSGAGLNPTSDRSLACGLGFKSLADCMGFPDWGFPPASETEHLHVIFPIHLL